MNYILYFTTRLLRNIISAIVILGCSYGFLALCNWNLSPNGWNGFSRFLAAIIVLIVVFSTWEALKTTVVNIRKWKAQDRTESERKQTNWVLDETRPDD